ncbi:hypothetical protein GCM10009788_39720 [Nocardioides humi]|uniref:Major facilitator superfamily (MFS) profile domain-containing protein n=1 Tax=Nocardioides humi TaxID=449461 RepID=A0ABN2B399_9ACTN
MAFILPGLKNDVAGSYASVGVLLTISYAGYTLGCLLIRWIVGPWGEVVILRVGLVGQAIAFVLIGLAVAWGVAAIGMCLSGVSSALVWISATALIGDIASPRWRNMTFGAAMSTTGLFVAGSGWLLTLLAGMPLPVPAWRAMVLAQGVVALGLVVAGFALGFRRPAASSQANAAGVLENGAGGRSSNVSVYQTGPSAGQCRNAVRRLTAVFFLFGATQVLFLNFFVAAVAAETDYSLAEATGFYSLVGIASVVGGVIGGRAVDALGPRPCMIACMGSLVVCSLVMVVELEVLIPPVAAFFGAAITAVGATSVAYLADVLPARAVSAAFAEITLGLGIGQMVSPYVGGWLIDTTGSFVSSYLLCLAASVAAAVAARTLPVTQRRTDRHV